METTTQFTVEKTMGAWIELHLDLRGHPKIIRLSNMLCVSVPEATGILINLWLFAGAYAKNGDLTKYSDKEIEAACMYERHWENATGGELVESLIECRWIDEKNGKKSVHDWKKYGMKLLQSNKRRVRNFREQKKLEQEKKHYGNVTVMATIPNLTVPNLTVPEIYTHVLPLWNDFAAANGLSGVMKLSEKRKTGIRARVQEKEFDLPRIFKEIEVSGFLKGANDRNWKVDFEFVFCSANNYLKILEGKYRNGPNNSNRGGLKIIKRSGAGGETNADDLRRTFEGTVFSETGTA